MSGYRAIVDVAGGADELRAIRDEQRDRRPRLHLKVLALVGPGGGNPLVQLRAQNRTALRAWLDANGYEDEPIDNLNNGNAVARTR